MLKSKGQPRRRLQHLYDVAKTKSVCEGGDSFDKKGTEGIEDAMKVVRTLRERRLCVRVYVCVRVLVQSIDVVKLATVSRYMYILVPL